ncbi:MULTISPECIES: hypothetical protein [Cyanophyceae]|uniref:hypothetical protein n=1 Tax=Cyanophyceae TaxID=3028117 RepID=UPI001686FAEA|nr:MULTISPECIES: hypothetical protein [Cyanophyceae]MBD1917243.1 hypothetical protein [Phormidium sp. FACHB-77]MBD2030774.1 hypothetical protein [Phormidium sp. FACHB-322]MBD2050118.1 hypothetical protein [Leptolyngbya sp. FACHB-60]
MTKLFTSRAGLVVSLSLGTLLSCCIGAPGPQGMPKAGNGEAAAAVPADPWHGAISEANRASQLAATAATATQWQQVAGAWGRSLTLLQTLPADDPRHVFSQRKAREYRQNLLLAYQKAEQQGLPRAFPALGSDVLDEQVSLYRAYVAAQGPPDVLIVGSSRSLQGIDPQVLQQALAVEGYPGLRVYNFSVNGATAQVVSFVTRQLLGTDLHPRLIVWAEGSRAFNSGRFDRTFAEILASPGYAAVQEGAKLTLQAQAPLASAPEDLAEASTETAASPETAEDSEGAEASEPVVEDGTESAEESEEAAEESTKTPDDALEIASETAVASYGTVPLTPINSQGFLAVNDQFNPTTYYRRFPRVRGQYDDSYRAFRLEGVQTLSLAAMTQFLQSQGIPLVFVNLPLSNDYLDGARTPYERQFQRFLQTWANQGAFTLVDRLEEWRWQSHLFADPSHVNLYGAREMARLIAADRRIPWPQAESPDEADTPTEAETESSDDSPSVGE